MTLHDSYVLESHADPFTFLEHRVYHRGVGEAEHAIAWQKPLSHSDHWVVLNCFCNALERVHVIGLNVMRYLFACHKGAESMTFQYARYRICRKDAKSVIQRTARTGRSPDDKVPLCNIPSLYEISAKRDDKFPCGRFAGQGTENEIVFVPEDIGS